jgi:four helix bundle protein
VVVNFGRYIRISLDSSSELEYHLLLAKDFDVMPAEVFTTLVTETIQIRKMLYGLLRKVDKKSADVSPKESRRR